MKLLFCLVFLCNSYLNFGETIYKRTMYCRPKTDPGVPNLPTLHLPGGAYNRYEDLTLIGQGFWMLLECRGAESARTF